MIDTFTIEVPDEVRNGTVEVTRVMQQKIKELVKGCQNSVRLTLELNRRNVTPEIMGINGMSAAKNRIFFNHLVSYPKARFLEVGVYHGSTFCAALAGNNPEYACAIDNYSQFGGSEKVFKENAKKFVKAKFDFFNRDCFDLTAAQKKKLTGKNINIYHYDGPHSEEDHVKSITEFYDYLDDLFILVVDDWNEEVIRRGTFKGIAEKKIKVWWQLDLEATIIDGNKDKAGWWNGVWVAVCQKRKEEE